MRRRAGYVADEAAFAGPFGPDAVRHVVSFSLVRGVDARTAPAKGPAGSGDPTHM